MKQLFLILTMLFFSTTGYCDEIITFADKNVKAICVANWDTNGDGELSKDEAAKVTELGDVFKNNIHISKFNELSFFTGLTDIRESFLNCTSLTEVTIPENVEILYCFANCPALSVVKLNAKMLAETTYYAMNLKMTGNPMWGKNDLNVYDGHTIDKLIIGNQVQVLPSQLLNDGARVVEFEERPTDSKLLVNVSWIGFRESGLSLIYPNCKLSFKGANAASDFAKSPQIQILGEIAEIIQDSEDQYGIFFEWPLIGTVRFSNELTKIPQATFRECSQLTSVILPQNLTVIGAQAFENCSSLGIPVFPTSLEVIGGDAFKGCVGLKGSLIFPDGVSIYNSAFSGCTGITSVSLPKNTKTVYNYAFQNCTNLASVTLPEGLQSIAEGAFAGCGNLTSITIPNTVTSIIGSFYNTGLTSVVIPNSVKRLQGWAFAYCDNLKSVTLGSGIEKFGGEGENDVSLKRGVFAHSENITRIKSLIQEPPYYYEQNDTYRNNRYFAEPVYSNATLIVPAGTLSVYKDKLGWKRFVNIVEEGDDSEPLSVGDTFESTVDGAWCKFLLTDGENVTLQSSLQDGQVVIPSTVTYNGVEYTITAIEGTETGISDKPNSTVFINKNSITGVVIPNTVTKIGACAFYGCSKITSLTIGSSVQNIGDYAFYDCLSLTSIIWGTSLKTIGKMAFNCDYDSKLTAVTIPNGIEEIGDNAFCMNSLTTVTLPTSIKKLSNGAFNNWQTSEMKVNISDLTAFSSIEMISDEYGYGFGFGKYRLYLNSTEVTDLTIPSGITKVGQIYAGCNSIQSLTFYKDVTEIAGLAFVECSNITKVTTLNKTPVNISSTIRFEDNVLKNATLQVPSGTTAAYKNAGWNFTNVEELEGLQDGDVFTAATNGGTLRFKVLSAADKTCQVGADNRSDGLVPGGGKWNRVIPSKVTGSDGQEYTVIGIGDRAFFEYDGIESFTLPTTLKQISEGAFMRCHDLKYITIPAGVTTMGKYIFNGQEVLTEVVSLIEDPYSIDESTFAGRYGNKATLVVPAGKKAAYENTDGWNLFTRIVEMNSGDADGNENVDEQDVNMVKEYIMTGKEPEGFVRQNADTQSNNKISVVDIVNILNIIKSKK